MGDGVDVYRTKMAGASGRDEFVGSGIASVTVLLDNLGVFFLDHAKICLGSLELVVGLLEVVGARTDRAF